MADVVHVDLSGVERRISSLETTLSSEISEVKTQVGAVSAQVTAAQSQLLKLQKDFQAMIEEQRKTAALEQAATELVTVRQEMEKRFGNYRAVRNSMLGILQATDAALVRKVTVSQVSEELMISTPDYWLAPVLVALSAWIGNNRDLADRAIREAVKRDNEHTSLVMALICRRNNRTQTCYEWLARYFAAHDAYSFEEDDMVYIDAYINGIFGPDEKHMCDDFITRWIDDIRGRNSNFEQDQEETWKKYFNSYNVNEAEKYPALKENVEEFGYIQDYLSRVDAVDSIADNFDHISKAYVDQDALREAVDKQLIKLVSADDKAERSLRDQEEYLLAVKACQGDVTAAKNLVNKQRQEKQQKRMDLVSQLTHTITDKKNALPSERKTAVSFLRNYINIGYNNYIQEKKSLFPTKISISLGGWKDTITDGSNVEELKESYSGYLEEEKEKELAQADKKYNPKGWQIGAAFMVVLAVICAIAAGPLAILSAIIAVILFVKSNNQKKAGEKAKQQLEEKYQRLLETGDQQINATVIQWAQARKVVRDFDDVKPEKVVA